MRPRLPWRFTGRSGARGKTLAPRDDILAVVAAAEFDVGPIADRIDAPEVAARLEAHTAEAAERPRRRRLDRAPFRRSRLSLGDASAG